MSTFFPRVPIDPSLYKLEQDELAFFKAQTGIQDDEELKNHILQVQAEAYAVYPYPCIRRFGFTEFKISKYPSYEAILKLGKERQRAILLDLGCCFGNDARKAIADGFPKENVITSDLHADFWDLGDKLFKTTRENFPVRFLAGDVFDPAFLSPDGSPAPTSAVSNLDPPPSLSSLTSLTPLQHHISVIHVGAFFHLFNKTQQRELARILATLLSPLPGSTIVGSHIGLPDTEECIAAGGMERNRDGVSIFGHCPTSWKALWASSDGVFKPQEVVVWATTQIQERKTIIREGEEAVAAIKVHHKISWSVIRV